MQATLFEAIIAATVTVLASGLGAVPFVYLKSIPGKITRAGWAAAGGLMLSASVFNLIIPGMEDGGISPVAVGIFLGALVMVLTALWLNNHDMEISGLAGADARRVFMILGTLTIHSFPEGIAIGVAYGSGEVNLGLIMAVAIGIHNIPEGMAVAMPLRLGGIRGWKLVMWAIVSGLPQLIAAVPAYLAVHFFRPILPYAFGFAAGAMILLVLSEMIPESRANEQQRLASAVSGVGGFLVMMILQNLLAF